MVSTINHPPPLDRQWFDLPEDVLWVMHCAEGPVPRRAGQAVVDFLPRETRPWNLRWEEDFLDIPARTRREGALVLDRQVDDVTLTSTTSSGLSIVSQGYPWSAGDEVLAPQGEFPSNAWPWRSLAARRVGWREVPLWRGHHSGEQAWDSTPPTAKADPEARLLNAIHPRTRVLTVSWVRFQDGLTLDLQRLANGCQQRGVDLVVDGIQGVGTRRPNLEGVAALAVGGHKGLLAPQGQGLLYTHEDFRPRLAPSGSWLSVEEATDFQRPSTDFDRQWLADGRRLEQGLPNLLGCVALVESLALLNQAGVGSIETHIAGLRRRLIAGLEQLPVWQQEAERLKALDDRGRLSSIVALHHGGRGHDFLENLLSEGTQREIHASVREGYLRIALHGWHSEAEVDRLLQWLEEAVAE